MSPAISYLEESADWLGALGEGGAPLRPPASWDFLTVAVLACERSCRCSGGCWAEEQVALAAEGVQLDQRPKAPE